MDGSSKSETGFFFLDDDSGAPGAKNFLTVYLHVATEHALTGGLRAHTLRMCTTAGTRIKD